MFGRQILLYRSELVYVVWLLELLSIQQSPIEDDEIGKQVIDLGVKILLIKAGHRGAYLITGDVSLLNTQACLNLSIENWDHRELWCNAYKADLSKVKNSSGAGDTAVAAFLTAILRSENPESSVKYATMAGRNNLYCTNLYDDLTNWQETTEEIRSAENELIYFQTVENKYHEQFQ